MERGKRLKHTPNPIMGSGKNGACQTKPERRSRAGMKKPRMIPTRMTRDWSRMIIDVSLSEFQAIEPRKNTMPNVVYRSHRRVTDLGRFQYAVAVKWRRR